MRASLGRDVREREGVEVGPEDAVDVGRGGVAVDPDGQRTADVLGQRVPPAVVLGDGSGRVPRAAFVLPRGQYVAGACQCDVGVGVLAQTCEPVRMSI
ncbi:MAG: hypothetical protein NVV66_00005, partial [Cellulomonas sp.]|uniref:hypothetical protein n=1 Tax=Cellulomonas sp. TaxID=40001 RepID=UPI00258A4E70